MSEQTQRKTVLRALKPLDAVAVENPACPGTPDVNYIEGWLELKWLRRWPDRAQTPVRIDHYTPQQRVWALRRAARGGKVHVLLQVRREWLLLPGRWCAEHLGRVPKSDLFSAAEWVWTKGLIARELIRCLRSDCPQEK